jgi:hypothetical protein
VMNRAQLSWERTTIIAFLVWIGQFGWVPWYDDKTAKWDSQNGCKDSREGTSQYKCWAQLLVGKEDMIISFSSFSMENYDHLAKKGEKVNSSWFSFGSPLGCHR